MPPRRLSSARPKVASTSSIESQNIFRKYGISPELQDVDSGKDPTLHNDVDDALETDFLIPPPATSSLSLTHLPPPSPSAYQTVTTIPYRIDVVSALLYVFGSALPVLVLFFEPKNRFVRFHAVQAFIYTMILIIAQSSFILLFREYMSLSAYIAIFILGSIPSLVFATLAYIETPSLIPFRIPLISELTDVLLA